MVVLTSVWVDLLLEAEMVRFVKSVVDYVVVMEYAVGV